MLPARVRVSRPLYFAVRTHPLPVAVAVTVLCVLGVLGVLCMLCVVCAVCAMWPTLYSTGHLRH